MKKMKKPTIIAMGGGGFSMEPDNLLLDEYILKITGKKSPRICFIGTASGDSEFYHNKFYTAFYKYDCLPTVLSLFSGMLLMNMEEFLLSQDVIYVGGGSTRNLLLLWKDWGIDKILFKAWKNGVVLAGLSAGSLCWFEEGVTDSNPGELSSLDCLGFLKGSHCPHYDGEINRRPSYHKLIKNGMKPGFAIDDSAAIHFENQEIKNIISSRIDARAYRVFEQNSEIIEEELDTFYLGN